MAGAGLLYVVLAIGALALYLGLPRSGRSMDTAGRSMGMAAVLCGSAALIGMTVFYAAGFGGEAGGDWFFYVCAAVAVVGAARVVTHRSPVYSALWFVLVVLAVALLLVVQTAEFLAVALVIVYAGAILVTYVFVIMLAQQSGPAGYDHRSREPLAAVLVGFVLMATVGGKIGQLPLDGSASAVGGEEGVVVGLVSERVESGVAEDAVIGESAGAGAELELDNTVVVGRRMLTAYVVAFEVGGLLLLVAMVGAIAISKKRMPVDVPQPAVLPPGQLGREAEPF